MVCCPAFNADPDAFENLTLKKVPQAVVDQCEWGKDDHFNVQNLSILRMKHQMVKISLICSTPRGNNG